MKKIYNYPQSLVSLKSAQAFVVRDCFDVYLGLTELQTQMGGDSLVSLKSAQAVGVRDCFDVNQGLTELQTQMGGDSQVSLKSITPIVCWYCVRYLGVMNSSSDEL